MCVVHKPFALYDIFGRTDYGLSMCSIFYLLVLHMHVVLSVARDTPFLHSHVMCFLWIFIPNDLLINLVLRQNCNE